MLKNAIVIVGHHYRKQAAMDEDSIQGITKLYNPATDYFLTTSGNTEWGSWLIFQLIANGFSVFEFEVRSHQKSPEYLWELLHMARYSALLDIGKEFHIFRSKSQFSTIEDLIECCRRAEKKLCLYDYTGAKLDGPAS